MKLMVEIPEYLKRLCDDEEYLRQSVDIRTLAHAIRTGTVLSEQADDVTFEGDNAVNRLSVRDIIYANAYELEYPDASSEYVVNRDEVIKYLMELPTVQLSSIDSSTECKSDDCISRESVKNILPRMAFTCLEKYLQALNDVEKLPSV